MNRAREPRLRGDSSVAGVLHTPAGLVREHTGTFSQTCLVRLTCMPSPFFTRPSPVSYKDALYCKYVLVYASHRLDKARRNGSWPAGGYDLLLHPHLAPHTAHPPAAPHCPIRPPGSSGGSNHMAGPGLTLHRRNREQNTPSGRTSVGKKTSPRCGLCALGQVQVPGTSGGCTRPGTAACQGASHCQGGSGSAWHLSPGAVERHAFDNPSKLTLNQIPTRAIASRR
jgi:hypothetical protein